MRHVYDAPGISYYFLSRRMGILFLSQREKSSSDQFVVDVSGILFISSVESAFESSGCDHPLICGPVIHLLWSLLYMDLHPE